MVPVAVFNLLSDVIQSEYGQLGRKICINRHKAFDTMEKLVRDCGDQKPLSIYENQHIQAEILSR
jgi:hypothetical protein